ncbi:hypothetical protein RQCS_62340 (plasmid) [Rhodococcus qingshengii]|nr:hypothetical protein RQCS_62340 [Rhodococcus qingshengii]
MVDSTRRIFAVIADPVPLEERAEVVIDELAHIVAYDAAQISCWDPHRSSYRTIASRGYTPDMSAALNGTAYRTDRVWEVLEHRRDPVFWNDCPFDRRDSEFYVDTVEAHGFGEGATMLLRDIRGEHMGMLSLSLESSIVPGADVQELVGIVGSAMLPLVDRLAPARQFAAMCSPQWPTAAFDPENGWTPLTPEGLPPQSLLDAATDALTRTNRPIRFCWHDPNPVHGGRRDQREPLLAELFPVTHPICRAVIGWNRQRLPYGLTRRELDVVALLATGASNAAIAERLSLSVRTVTTHVERILAKTAAPTRTAVALLANHEGLLRITEKYVI